MVKKEIDEVDNNVNDSTVVIKVAEGTCPVAFHHENLTKEHLKGEFDWDHQTQGVLLSSFFYGYICFQLFSGYLVRLIGPRFLLAISMGGTGVMSLLAPLAARTHVYLLVANRVLTGVFQVCLLKLIP